MMIRDAFARGDLRAAITLAGATVREQPRDEDARFTLLDLLSFAGEWERADKQLAALADAPGVAEYRLLIGASRERAAFFAQGGPPPAWLIEPPAWAERHLAACERLRLGDHAGARLDFDAVEAARPDLGGTMAGVPWAGWRDLDDRLGPVLELILPGGYSWVAWEDVQFLDVAPPSTLRDLLWAPARVALAQGPIGWVHLPALYPGTEAATGPLQVGQATDWREVGSNLAVGVGLKEVLAGEQSLGLFDLRDLQFFPASPPSVE